MSLEEKLKQFQISTSILLQYNYSYYAGTPNYTTVFVVFIFWHLVLFFYCMFLSFSITGKVVLHLEILTAAVLVGLTLYTFVAVRVGDMISHSSFF
jgi:ACR3 family arsenite efflux pump ArsB